MKRAAPRADPPCSRCAPEAWAAWLAEHGDDTDRKWPHLCFTCRLVVDGARTRFSAHRRAKE